MWLSDVRHAGCGKREIKELEVFLKTPLFVRGHHQIVLTKVGYQYHRAVCPARNDLRAATSRTGEKAARNDLRITVYATFSMRWLVPRPSGFHRRHADMGPCFDVAL
jgi:LysR family transcriptional regulator, glycine cleavage system transcriptional activator